MTACRPEQHPPYEHLLQRRFRVLIPNVSSCDTPRHCIALDIAVRPPMSDSDATTAATTNLVDLPEGCLLLMLARLDVFGLCSVSRTCSLLNRLASHSMLWPHHEPEGCVLAAARLALANVTRLPPQARSRVQPATDA